MKIFRRKLQQHQVRNLKLEEYQILLLLKTNNLIKFNLKLKMTSSDCIQLTPQHTDPCMSHYYFLLSKIRHLAYIYIIFLARQSRLPWCHVALLCRANNTAPSFLHPLRRIRAPLGCYFHYWHSIHRACIFEPPCARPPSPYELHFFFSLEAFYSFDYFFLHCPPTTGTVFYCHLYIGKK